MDALPQTIGMAKQYGNSLQKLMADCESFKDKMNRASGSSTVTPNHKILIFGLYILTQGHKDEHNTSQEDSLCPAGVKSAVGKKIELLWTQDTYKCTKNS